MKKKKILFLIGLVLSASLFYYFLSWHEKDDEEIDIDFFDPGDRYQHDILNYMDVCFEKGDDIYLINGGFSTTNSSPWARIHLGFDFPFKNGSNVLAATPGQVSRIEYKYWADAAENQYMVGVVIRFNQTTYIGYNFEPWTVDEDVFEHQKRLINVKEGDWVQIGDVIGVFLNAGTGSHVHFDVIENEERIRIDKYMSQDACDRLLALCQLWNPSWTAFCYDEFSPLDFLIDPFEDISDISQVINGYSNTSSCPWGYVHLGFDFYFDDMAKVMAAASGQITSIEIIDRFISPRYFVRVIIKYNDTTQLIYDFETGTSLYTDAELMLSFISKNEGDWLVLDWNFALFRKICADSHIFFTVEENGVRYPIDRYYSSYGFGIMEELVHSFHPTWNVCYY